MESSARILENLDSVLPHIAKRAGEAERARQLPDDLFAELTAAGCFRMLVPRSHGGADIGLPDALRVIERVARADGAAGWLVAVLSSAPLIFGLLPDASFDEIYAAGPDVIGAGALAPKGAAVEVADGWRVTGRWPFVSGCRYAEWFYLHCVVFEDGKPLLDTAQRPVMRMMVVPTAAAKVIDTWQSLGLRGTGSHDVRAAATQCPASYSCTVLGEAGVRRQDGLVINDQLGFVIGAVAVGIAAGALAEICELAAVKRPAFSAQGLAQSPVFQDRLGEAQMKLVAAQALLADQARVAVEPSPEPVDRLTLRATGATVTRLAASVVDTAYELAGGSSVFDSSPVQRRFRDIHSVTQHAVTGREFFRTLGAGLAGLEGDAVWR
ncbi:acyl-CoA dehydrogenase family protein [Nocardia iowensis]|uniref:Acyl-CoA dehydrogenase family protein n=1 Tax=Nocardia iowensis TaxID=204891 RepID=A0ABX8RHT1_NOCIO|nr:acyl-CoA dehydrogenase family protein [Nocardia iowensis]QXN88442.1 acyl-CoA dehydrogenase family protein [Nocardia iowensis]